MFPLNRHWRSRVYITSSVHNQGSLHLACPKNASCVAEAPSVRGSPRSLMKIPTNKQRSQAHALAASEKRSWMPIKKKTHINFAFAKQSDPPKQHSCAVRDFLA